MAVDLRRPCTRVVLYDVSVPSFASSFRSYFGRRKRARPSSLAIFAASFLQTSVRDANFASCVLKVFGGRFAKNFNTGARSSKRSSSLVARDNMTYRSSHQSSSSFALDVFSCRPQSMMTPSRIVRPWQAVEVMARACEMGKPVRVTVQLR